MGIQSNRFFLFYRSEHYNNLQKEEEKLNSSINNNTLATSPLKDNSNIQHSRNGTTTTTASSVVSETNGCVDVSTVSSRANDRPKTSTSSQSNTSTAVNTNTPYKNYTHKNPLGAVASTTTTSVSVKNSERPLKCLETLAQKAGITFDEKYEVASTLLTLEKSQSPAQQVAAPTSVPLQISHEQLQQLQYFQQAFVGGTAVQVKQEFPNQSANTMSAELKQQIAEHNQAQQVQQMQIVETSPSSPHQTPNSTAMGMPQGQQTTTINTMSPLQLSGGQVPADWGHRRVQVVQQPIQNPAYLQQIYGGQQVLMNSNIIPGLGPQVQVIAAGKPFQGGQITSQMLAQGKPVLGNSQGFSGAYALPTSQPQTLLFSPVSAVNVISSPQQQQQNILPAIGGQNSGNKPQTQQDLQKALQGQKVMQKVGTTNNVNGTQTLTNNQQGGQQCVQVSQAMPTAQLINPIQQGGTQHMQFAPWQPMQQFWATNGLSPQTMLAQNSRYIIATQPDGTQGLQFIQQHPQANSQTIQTQPQTQTLTALSNNIQQNVQAAAAKPRMVVETLAPKLQAARTPTILPQGGNPPIRPASSVSTQTAQNQAMLNQKSVKMRTKPHAVRPAAPNNIKTDASNQTKVAQQQTIHQVSTSAGNK